MKRSSPIRAAAGAARDVADAGRLDHQHAGSPLGEGPYTQQSSVTKPSSVARQGTIAGTHVRARHRTAADRRRWNRRARAASSRSASARRQRVLDPGSARRACSCHRGSSDPTAARRSEAGDSAGSARLRAWQPLDELDRARILVLASSRFTNPEARRPDPATDARPPSARSTLHDDAACDIGRGTTADSATAGCSSTHAHLGARNLVAPRRSCRPSGKILNIPRSPARTRRR